jgi:hypothetical protein
MALTTKVKGFDPMPPRISAFPKCYLDEIAAARTIMEMEMPAYYRSTHPKLVTESQDLKLQHRPSAEDR